MVIQSGKFFFMLASKNTAYSLQTNVFLGRCCFSQDINKIRVTSFGGLPSYNVKILTPFYLLVGFSILTVLGKYNFFSVHKIILNFVFVGILL